MKRWLVTGSFLANLSVLGFFKYFDFFLHNFNRILNVLHIQVIDNPFSFLLPVGISFYTFQALSYTADVYKDEITAEKNFLKYALFVSFFPQLVAGPIERSGKLLTQIQNMNHKKMWDFEKVISGFAMMIWGLFQKMVIADRVAIFVNGVFDNVYRLGTVDAAAGAFAFALQIYCDFAGYSCIAVGAASIMGFELTENFNAPYFAESISDFWHRWHISLSTWFRDYVYIPLGGNRCSRGRKYVNIFITFLVSGLWHGAAWTYVSWGILHGVYQIVGDILRPVRKRITEMLKTDTDAFSYHFGKIVVTFLLTSFAWIFFRAPSVDNAIYYVQRMVTKWNPWALFDETLFSFGLDRREMNILFLAVIFLILVDIVKYRNKWNFGEFLLRQNLWFRYGVLILLVICALTLGVYGVDFDSGSFIYFVF